MSNSYCVYMHTTPSGKHYIGITSQDPQRRWRKHGKGYKDSPCFFNAIVKYGWENIKHEIIIDNLNYREAEYYEKYYIALYRATDRKYGYNLESGGTSGKQLSEETKYKLHEANKGKGNPDKLKTWRENGGVPWNKGSKGMTSHDDEWKRKMSKRMSGSNNPAYGKNYSIYKTDYTNTKRGIEHPLSKAIEQYSIDGTYIATFDTITELAKSMGKTKSQDISNVVKCAKGKRPTAYGYVWRYREEVI